MRPAFHVLHEAWYSTQSRDQEIMIGLYADEGGTDGEFAIRWRSAGPRLEMFSDAWHLLVIPEFAALISAIAAMDDATPDDIVAVLKKLNFADITNRTRP